jgi:hypothetical protein
MITQIILASVAIWLSLAIVTYHVIAAIEESTQ